jgi:hypothetical protein
MLPNLSSDFCFVDRAAAIIQRPTEGLNPNPVHIQVTMNFFPVLVNINKYVVVVVFVVVFLVGGGGEIY